MKIIAQACWRSKELNSTENFRLIRQQAHWCLQGEVTITEPGQSIQWDYQIICNQDWQTQAVSLQSSIMSPLVVRRDGQGNWSLNQIDVPALKGAQDIDLGFTPATNILPIRRQQPKIEDTVVCHAAWFKPQDGCILPVEQYYTRLEDSLYEYHNPASGFLTQLRLDRHGLVQHYGDIWVSD